MFENNKKLTVINFFAGPGVGKSTTAAALFATMKRNGENVELVHEFAKELVWEKRDEMFSEQDYILAQQHRLIRRLVSHDIDYAIVDSSLVLGILYAPEWYPKSLTQLILDLFNSYTNINIFLERNRQFPYVEEGRNETYEQALEKDQQLKQILHMHTIPYISFVNDTGIENNIYSIIKQLTHK